MIFFANCFFFQSENILYLTLIHTIITGNISFDLLKNNNNFSTLFSRILLSLYKNVKEI